MHFFQNLAQVTITTEQVLHFKVMSQMILHCPVEHTKMILDMQIVWRRGMCHKFKVCLGAFLLGSLTTLAFGAIQCPI